GNTFILPNLGVCQLADSAYHLGGPAHIGQADSCRQDSPSRVVEDMLCRRPISKEAVCNRNGRIARRAGTVLKSCWKPGQLFSVPMARCLRKRCRRWLGSASLLCISTAIISTRALISSSSRRYCWRLRVLALPLWVR